MTDTIKIAVRDYSPSDQALVMSTWLRGQRFGGNYARVNISDEKDPFSIDGYYAQIPTDIYYREYEKIITEVLSNPEVRIEVATDETDPLWVVGYIVYKPGTLYWIYVKPEYRKLGIASLLLKNKEIKITKSTTKIGRSITYKKGWIFNPFKE